MFESPLAIPRKVSNSASLDSLNASQASAAGDIDYSPSAGRMDQQVSSQRARPSPVFLKSPQSLDLYKVNDRIRDILWNVGSQEDSEILAPDEEEIGAASPFFAAVGGMAESQDTAIAVLRDTKAGQVAQVAAAPSQPTATGKAARKIPTLVGPNALPYARCPS